MNRANAQRMSDEEVCREGIASTTMYRKCGGKQDRSENTEGDEHILGRESTG